MLPIDVVRTHFYNWKTLLKISLTVTLWEVLYVRIGTWIKMSSGYSSTGQDSDHECESKSEADRLKFFEEKTTSTWGKDGLEHQRTPFYIFIGSQLK